MAPPTGYVRADSVIVFTDIEGSTRLAERLGDARWSEAVSAHHEIVHRCFNSLGGFEASNHGDGFLYLFASATDAVTAARLVSPQIEAAHGLPAKMRVRIAIHVGQVDHVPRLGLIGIDIHRCSRLVSAAAGGQILLSGEAAERVAELVPRRDLVEHGRFRLKDLRTPERIVELTVDGRGASAPMARRVGGLLPLVLTDLIGRSDQLERLVARVDAGSGGVVLSLCGTGGVGKTRLAIELLRTVDDRISVLVDLSRVEHEGQAIAELAKAAGLDPADIDHPDRGAIETVAAAFEAERTLVVLDNLEQIIEIAPHVSELARLAPNAVFVATSRRPLRIGNEELIDVDPLATEPDEGATMSPAAALFVALARTGDPPADDLELIETTCRELDGLPLAIELAVGRLKTFGLAELGRELGGSVELLAEGRRDLPTRHQAIDRTVAWSYELLSPTAQDVLRWLSLLPAGATAPTVVSLTGLRHATAMTAIAELDEHRLVQHEMSSGGDRRVQVLRVIRDAIRDKLLAPAEEEAMRVRCAEHLGKVVNRTTRALQGPDQEASFARLQDEKDNLTALFGWAMVDPQYLGRALATASRMVVFWWQAHLEDGIEWLGRLTSLPEARAQPEYIGGLVNRAVLATYGGAAGEAMALATEAVAACRRAGRNDAAHTMALQIQAAASSAWGDGERALASIEEALAIDRQLDEPLRAFQQVSHGNIFLAENHVDRARALFQESLDIFRGHGDSWICATPMTRLAECALREGDHDGAEELATAALARWKSGPGFNTVVRAQSNLARVRWSRGQIDDARSLAVDAVKLANKSSNRGDLPWATMVLAAVESARDNHAEAAVLFGLSQHLAESYAQPIRGCLGHELRPAVEASRSAVGERADELWRQGAAMTVPEAFARLGL